MSKKGTGHLLAIITILIWGTTFISTKILLNDFKPVEILFLRFLIGLVILYIVCPKKLKSKNKKEELMFALAGLCGVCLYYLLENIALTYTTASNVGIIISIAPFFTGIASHLILKSENLNRNFYIGFLTALIGIVLISFNGNLNFNLNPIGDILALLAAIVWALYSILTRIISSFNYPTLLTTRRIFTYGILFMLPIVWINGIDIQIEQFANITILGNILFLGIGASALCFVSWNSAVRILGAVKTSTYIYLVPVITITTSIIFLNESITWMIVLGTFLTLSGLFLSEK